MNLIKKEIIFVAFFAIVFSIGIVFSECQVKDVQASITLDEECKNILINALVKTTEACNGFYVHTFLNLYLDGKREKIMLNSYGVINSEVRINEKYPVHSYYLYRFRTVEASLSFITSINVPEKETPKTKLSFEKCRDIQPKCTPISLSLSAPKNRYECNSVVEFAVSGEAKCPDGGSVDVELYKGNQLIERKSFLVSRNLFSGTIPVRVTGTDYRGAYHAQSGNIKSNTVQIDVNCGCTIKKAVLNLQPTVIDSCPSYVKTKVVVETENCPDGTEFVADIIREEKRGIASILEQSFFNKVLTLRGVIRNNVGTTEEASIRVNDELQSGIYYALVNLIREGERIEPTIKSNSVELNVECLQPPEEPPLPLETFTLRINKGWNLVSIPFSSSLSITEDNCRENIRAIFGYSPQEKKYYKIKSIEEMKFGYGYWIFSRENCEITLSGNWGTKAELPNLYKGWNVVGALNTTVSIDEIKNNCNIISVFTYDSENKKYVRANQLESGKGYWIYVRNDCKLGE
ncbi:MAG: hypothetical protein QXQ14_03580 [Candidatus Aenigmatarchaeota archaeon]